jgi:hypothetical protein
MGALEVVSAFNEAFVQRNGPQMAAFYSDGVEFSDPVFPLLRGEEAKCMWRMLCAKSSDLRVEYEILSHAGNKVQVKWQAYYSFGPAARKVHNSVIADLLVENEKILRHTDQFNFWKWSSQALGPVGFLFGWNPFLQRKVQAGAQKSLRSFLNRSVR